MSKVDIIAVAALLCFTHLAAHAAPAQVWSVSVIDLKSEPLGTVTLELTDESTHTCMAGKEWKKARVIDSSFPSLARLFETKGYFPTYTEDGPHAITIQLNPSTLCDGYLFLGGKFTEHEAKGDYFTFNMHGGDKLGTFTAKKQ